MAKEYKYMFDRRFDEPEETDSAANENLPQESVDGIPSISELLDTIKDQTLHILEKETVENAKNESETEETSNEEISDEEISTEDSSTTPIDEENVASSLETVVSDEESAAVPSETFFPEKEIFSGIGISSMFSEGQLKEAEEKAREEGRNSGLEEGRLKGLEEGRLKGMEEGHETAWQEAMVSIEKQNSDTLSSIDESLKNILNSLEENSQKSFNVAVEFAMAVCRKALPFLCEKHAAEEIRTLLEKNLCFLKDEPKISLRLNPFLADKIKPLLTDLLKKEAYHGKVSVIRDNSLPVGDCCVEWKNGGLEKRTQDVLNHTEELVKLYTHTQSADE